jgi:hypothetical protein
MGMLWGCSRGCYVIGWRWGIAGVGPEHLLVAARPCNVWADGERRGIWVVLGDALATRPTKAAAGLKIIFSFVF